MSSVSAAAVRAAREAATDEAVIAALRRSAQLSRFVKGDHLSPGAPGR
jgi:hypothetical protein